MDFTSTSPSAAGDIPCNILEGVTPVEDWMKGRELLAVSESPSTIFLRCFHRYPSSPRTFRFEGQAIWQLWTLDPSCQQNPPDGILDFNLVQQLVHSIGRIYFLEEPSGFGESNGFDSSYSSLVSSFVRRSCICKCTKCSGIFVRLNLEKIEEIAQDGSLSPEKSSPHCAITEKINA
ncbi:hypothetical protein AVEN_102458-1 [Araneus ventricosus]|uniref:Uncharacterized protein n=1 Tax=Araneus ventricosus TaxID=182803 RepID=A0A4Y1ZWV5_ARAVE|nr:hypothetical protein AVEN_102458-1 [Araneus ventricosus]